MAMTLLPFLLTQLLLVPGHLVPSKRSLSQDLLPSCFSEDKTWDVESAISVHVDLTSMYECQSVCSDTDTCAGFTWTKGSHPQFPHMCLLFPFRDLPLVDCSDCISGPPTSSCTCSDNTSCDIAGDNGLHVQTSVLYEIECQMLCLTTKHCVTYTWYDDWHDYKHMCFLFSECSQSSSCDGCHSGPPLCEDISSSTGMSSTADTTTTTASTTTTTSTTTTVMTTTTVSSICNSDNIKVLDDSTRSVKSEDGPYCDRMGHHHASPDWQGRAWYRFAGPDYTRMADSPPGEYHCGTDAPGYLVIDNLPSVEDGSKEAKLCFQLDGDKCHREIMETVAIVNCGDFFLYELPDTPSCYYRYCGI